MSWQCGQFQKIGWDWGSKPNREKFYILQKKDTTSTRWRCLFLITGQVTKTIFEWYLCKDGSIKSYDCPPIFQNVHKSRCSRIKMISDRIVWRNVFIVVVFIISYSDISTLIFLHLTPLRSHVFAYILPRNWKWIWPHIGSAESGFTKIRFEDMTKIPKNPTYGMPECCDISSDLAYHWSDFSGFCIISSNMKLVKLDSVPYFWNPAPESTNPTQISIPVYGPALLRSRPNLPCFSDWHSAS